MNCIIKYESKKLDFKILLHFRCFCIIIPKFVRLINKVLPFIQ